jgi:hypothetical protein
MINSMVGVSGQQSVLGPAMQVRKIRQPMPPSYPPSTVESNDDQMWVTNSAQQRMYPLINLSFVALTVKPWLQLQRGLKQNW